MATKEQLIKDYIAQHSGEIFDQHGAETLDALNACAAAAEREAELVSALKGLLFEIDCLVDDGTLAAETVDENVRTKRARAALSSHEGDASE